MLVHTIDSNCRKMISITLQQNIAAPPSKVRDTLLDHEQLNRFFNADFRLIRKQNDGEIKGGKGAVRQVTMIGATFKEKIISADHNHISYQIIGNKPVADHRGDIHFCEATHFDEKNTSSPITEITYHITCKSPWWLPNPVLKPLIKRDIIQALKKLAIYFKETSL